MLRVGIISTAHMHAVAYVAGLVGRGDARLSGLYDDDPARASSSAARFGATAFPSLDALLQNSDAVVICSENVKHRPFAEASLAAGKPTLSEKPLATTPENAVAMVRASERAGVGLYTAFPCRFSPAYVRMKAAIQAGEIGEILAVRATNQGKCPGGWFVQKELSGGGAVMDHTVHVADLLRDLLHDEASEVFCESGNGLLHQDFDDTGVLTITFEKGVFASLDASWSRPKTFPTWGNVTMGVIGTAGVFEMDMFGQSSLLYADGASPVSERHWGSDIDSGMIDAFVRAATGDLEASASLASGIDGLRAVEIVDAAYRSSETNQPARVIRSV